MSIIERTLIDWIPNQVWDDGGRVWDDGGRVWDDGGRVWDDKRSSHGMTKVNSGGQRFSRVTAVLGRPPGANFITL